MVMAKLVDADDSVHIDHSEEDVNLVRLRLGEAEAHVIQAAQYGQQLLQKVHELEQQLERRAQSEHHLTLRLEAKDETEQALLEEVDALRSSLSQTEDEFIRNREREINSLRNAMDARESALNERIESLEKQLQENIQQAEQKRDESDVQQVAALAELSEAAVTEELLALQEQQIKWERERSALQREQTSLRAQLSELETERELLLVRMAQLESKLDDMEAEMVAYKRSAEQAREEAQELQNELEHLRLSTDLSEGRSLFAEVGAQNMHSTPRIDTNNVERNDAVDCKKDVFEAKVMSFEENEHFSRLSERISALENRLSSMQSLKGHNSEPVLMQQRKSIHSAEVAKSERSKTLQKIEDFGEKIHFDEEDEEEEVKRLKERKFLELLIGLSGCTL